MEDWQFPQRPPGPSYRMPRRRVINVGGPGPWPRYLAWVVVVTAAVLLGRLAWQASRYFFHSPETPAVAPGSAAEDPSKTSRFAPWERDLLLAIQNAVEGAEAGRVVDAEVEVDRAASMATALRLQSRVAHLDFFAVALAGLDRVLAAASADPDMMDHVMQARVALAELRSSENSVSESRDEIEGVPVEPNAIDGSNVGGPKSGPKHVSIDSPRELAADSVLTPATIGGRYLDATFMPDTSEILLPPSTRAFADNVRVEGLTIAGAAQTLDGIHWHDVTFVGTHLRYESGELDLRDVRFVNCRFGFPSDEGGARLADAIALGQTSILVDRPGPPSNP